MGLQFDLPDEDIKVFLDEAEEVLQLLDEGILKLEQDGCQSELIQDIFRAAHTLKGSSATLGHTRMAEMTHHMENIFDKLRCGDTRVNSDLIDVLLEALDALKVFKEEIETREENPNDYSSVIDKLSSLTGGKQEESAGSVIQSNELNDLITSEEVKGSHILKINMELRPDCLMPAVRIFQIYEEIKNLGKILYCKPSEDEISNGESGSQAFVIVGTQEPEFQFVSTLNSIPDLSTAKVSPYQVGENIESNFQTVKEDETPKEQVNSQGDAEKKEQNVSKGSKPSDKSSRTIRVDVERLDKLMNLVGELVIGRTQLDQIGDKLKNMDESSDITRGLIESTLHIGRITSDLQEEIVSARMLPIERVFNKFPRMMRDLAKRCDKEVEFIITGKETELDRSVIEEIGDPLIHILRNAIDHGVEIPEEREKAGKPKAALVHLSAKHQEGQIVIEVDDDGKGIDCRALREKAVSSGFLSNEVATRMTDHEAMQLIFNSGISTAKEVTNISGRGVGMDIVRTNIEKLNGTVEVFSQPGKGSKFIIKLPLTLAIIQALLISVSGKTFAVPLNLIVETIRLDPGTVKFVNQKETLVVRGQVLPLLRLNEVFGFARNGNNRYFVVIISFGGNKVGFVVDYLIGEQEIVVKSLGNYISNIKGISGATILGDGKVALIVDAPSLVNSIVKELNKVAGQPVKG